MTHIRPIHSEVNLNQHAYHNKQVNKWISKLTWEEFLTSLLNKEGKATNHIAIFVLINENQIILSHVFLFEESKTRKQPRRSEPMTWMLALTFLNL